jgi:hypothetical protein
MGTVLRFPTERVRGALVASYRPKGAEILILPVVQVERGTFGFAAVPDLTAPEDGEPISGGKRRRRAPRG